MIIRPENTAIVNGISKSVLEVEKAYKKGCIVLDYGAGKLRNSNYLLGKDIDVHILDTEYQLDRINKQNFLNKYEKVYNTKETINIKYDIILCSFVLNVIPDINTRDFIIQNCNSILKEEGIFILEVRREKGIMKNKNMEPYNDGFLVGKGNIRTFQKPYNDKELFNILISNGFKVVKVWNENDSVIAIATK